MGVDYTATVGYGVLLEPGEHQYELAEELCAKAAELEGPGIAYSSIGVSWGYGGEERILVGYVQSTNDFDPIEFDVPNPAYLDEVSGKLRELGLKGARWYFGMSCW